jgi:hypothetical protein
MRLTEYFTANRGRFTDEALVDAARRGGYPDDQIQTVLAERRAAEVAPPVRSRAIRRIVIAYVVVYALLDLGMLANAGKTAGYLMPSAIGGIGILTASLGVALVASLVWMASRRAFGVLLFVGLTLVTIGGPLTYLSNPQYASPTSFIPPAIGILGVVWLVWSRRSDPAVPAGPPSMELLLVVPLLLLLGVGGLCLASGLPIPRPA